jgi:DNA-binding transcriptional LysR family regulator
VLVRNPAGIVIDLWEFARGDEKASVKVNGWLCSTGREVVLDAVLAGEGIARLNHLTTRAHLQAGRLVPVLPEWEVQGGPPINLLFRPSQRRTPRVRVFLDFVTELLRDIEAEAQARAALPHWHRTGYGRASSVLRARRTPAAGASR